MFNATRLRRLAVTTIAVPALLLSGASMATAHEAKYHKHEQGASAKGAYDVGLWAKAKKGEAKYFKYWKFAGPHGAKSGHISAKAR